MFFNDQKVTKVEACSISIAQWCVIDHLPEALKGAQVFITQATVTTVHPGKLKNTWAREDGKEYKGVRLKMYFTTLHEHQREYGFGKVAAGTRPCVEGELMYENIGRVPVIRGFLLQMKDYYDTDYTYMAYDELRAYDVERYPAEKPMHEREERFKIFFQAYSCKAFVV